MSEGRKLDNGPAEAEKPPAPALASMFDMDALIAHRLKSIEPLMQKIGIPEGTIGGLLKVGSDWEFIIQLAVILEAALVEALVSHLHNEQLRGHLQRLNMSGRAGKIPLAEQVDLLTGPEAGTMSQISEIRNAFAHSPKNIGSSLEMYAAKTPDPRGLAGRLLAMDKEITGLLFAKGHSWFPPVFRYWIWLAGGQALASLALKDREAEGARLAQKMQQEMWNDAQQGALGLSGLFAAHPSKVGDWW